MVSNPKPLTISRSGNQFAAGSGTSEVLKNAQMMMSTPAEASPISRAVMEVQLLYMEDFDPEVDPEFIRRELRPYFQGVFADLALRSTQPAGSQSRKIDKVTFVEYVNLPGIVSDRFHALACHDHTDGRVQEDHFIELMLQVFSSSVETKMRLSFKM